jgi:Ca2+-binding EF-hand superfamily protein
LVALLILRLTMVDNRREAVRSDDECTVTKAQLLRFFEEKFQISDRDQDGQLTIAELSDFLRFVTHPDLRALSAWDRYR